MRIRLTKVSDLQHALELVRDDGSCETVELVTREALFHDFLHFAVEHAMGTQGGFWGALASGKTMADLNDRTGATISEFAKTLYEVERAVGMMTGSLKSEAPAARAAATMREYHAQLQQGEADWCTEAFVAEVREQMRRLMGQWKSTPFGQSMEIVWVEEDQSGR